MKHRIFVALMATVWAYAAPANAEESALDYSGFLKAELYKVDHFNPEQWLFTQTTTNNGDVTVAKYDPSRSAKQRWILVSRNNKAANYDQMTDFRDDQYSRDKKQRNRIEDSIEDNEPLEDGLVALFDWDSLQLVDRGEKHLVLSFQPRFDRFDDDEETRLAGAVTIDQFNKQIVSIDVVNVDAPVSVNTNTNIEADGELDGDEESNDESAEIADFPFESFTFNVEFTYIDGAVLVKTKSTFTREEEGLFGGDEERDSVIYENYQPLK